MKTLLLLRHAKSAWADPALEDFDRPLAPRGIDAATRMGRYLCRDGLVPERILCSPARRAAQTLTLVLAQLKDEPPVETARSLYLGGWPALLAAVQTLPATTARAMLVAHNPDLQDLALTLAGTGPAASLQALAEKLPTGGLVVLTFPGPTWSAVAAGAGTLVALVCPRELS